LSIRIYALAQQLKVETKTLVDAIKNLGIEGKGSALASLTEDEVKLVKEKFQKTTSKQNKHGMPNTNEWQPSRPSVHTDQTTKKIPVIKIAAQGTQKDDTKTQTKDNDDVIHTKDQSKTTTKDHTDKDHTDKSHVDKSHVDKSHTDKSHVDKSHADKSHTDKSHADKSHVDKSHADKSHADKSHVDKSHVDKSHVDKSHVDKSHVDKSHVDKSHVDKSHADKSHADKSHTDKSHADKSHAETSDKTIPAALVDTADNSATTAKSNIADTGTSKKEISEKNRPASDIKNISTPKKELRDQKQKNSGHSRTSSSHKQSTGSATESKGSNSKSTLTTPLASSQSSSQLTSSAPVSSHPVSKSATSISGVTAGTSDISGKSAVPQSPVSSVGKIVETKPLPKLPPAIGHIDISSIPGAGSRSNQYRGGKSHGNRDSKNRSGSPLDQYRRKSGGGDGKQQQQQQRQGGGSSGGGGGGGGNSQRTSQQQQQQQQQQQKKQGQGQYSNQKPFQDRKSDGHHQSQSVKKSLTSRFDTNNEILTRNNSYLTSRTPIDNKIPDLDNNKDKISQVNRQDNKQDTGKSQINSNNKKPVNIYLAPIPTVKTKKPPKEPQAQKPDKRLPVDVIRNVLTSGSGLSVDEYIRKHKDKQLEKEEARRARESSKKGGGGRNEKGGSGDRNRSGNRDRSGTRNERFRDQNRDRDQSRNRDQNQNRDRDRDRDQSRSVERVGEKPINRSSKESSIRLPDRVDKGGKLRSDRDRHNRSGRGGSDSVMRTMPPPYSDFGGNGRTTVRDSSRIAEEKRRIHSKKRSRHNNEDYDDMSANVPRQLKRIKSRDGKAVSTAAPRKNNLVIHLPCTIKQFAEQTGTTLTIVIKKLLELGIRTQLNSQLDVETVELIAESLEIQVTIKENVSLEDRLVTTLFEQEDAPETLVPRPPIVTVLGHVDHGKTTMLDNILKLNVVSGEKGGITQHIRAYRVKMENGEDITFVDTPGHEAFTEMRARGAGCTDIAILVVAADDGVMPQTEEAISHAKAAGVPIIVAINKMDLPSVNPDRVMQELAANDLLPEEWGGDVPIVRCSGLTGMGLDKLLETIQLMAEIHELKANPNREAIGVALEAELQSGQGAVCKVIVQKGTLRTGDIVLCGTAHGRVKAMYDTLDTKKQIYEAAPSTPVNLVGLDVAPGAGSRFCVLEDISDARVIAEQRQIELRKNELAEVQSHVTLETLFQRIKDSQTIQTLNVIIRADVRGSIEAIRKELAKLSHPEVKIKILQSTVGGISEADVHLADASDAIIVGFNVVPDENARIMAEKKKIQIRRYDIIYNLTDDIKKALEGMLKPLEHVKELGRAVVQQVFVISRIGTIAGCRVTYGNIERDCKIRIIRENRIIGEYPLDSLKREKDDVKEVREGYECGIKLKGFNDLKEGDVLEAYKIESVARTF
jgi:translation initiation factor IF-2